MKYTYLWVSKILTLEPLSCSNQFDCCVSSHYQTDFQALIQEVYIPFCTTSAAFI